ncbi:asparagine synthase, partial [Teladorsagia circumcincta]
AADLVDLEDPEAIVSVLLSRSGPWSVVYYRPDLRRLFVGRDVFGRLSLVYATDADDLILSDVVQILPDVSRTKVSPTAPAQDIVVDFLQRLVSATRSMIPSGMLESLEDNEKETKFGKEEVVEQGADSIAVAFSGGVDSLLVAVALHEAYPPERIIDLVNVAFIRDSQHRSIVTDRQRAIAGLFFLRSKFPARTWRLILADVTKEELEKKRLKHIVKAAAPALSVLDESLACVLWFALRGAGKDYDNGCEVWSDARVYFVGSGADELFAGYARHRTRFERDGAGTVPEECEAELNRLGSRNGGRDARVAVVLKKELRAPFLQDDFVAWVNTVPMDLKCNLTLPRGVGEKMIIRQVLASLGAPHNAPKQAMQFGSGFVKMQNNKALKGSDISHHLLGAHHSIPSGDL